MGIAVLTGGSSGIGQAAAIRIAERGNGVILTYHQNKEGAADTVAAIERNGGSAAALHLDVGDADSFGSFADRVTEELADRWDRRDFDYLVNNAGVSGPTMFPDVTPAQFERFVHVIMRGPFFLIQTLLPLIVNGGAIVNTTSNSAIPTGMTSGYSAYASAKGGLITMTRLLAKELAGRQIRVNGVSPGPTRTRIADDAFARHPEVIPAIAAETAFGRVGEPDDVGRVIAALLSDDFAWVTGENLEASGGFHL
ncbi:SDR family NAD(P)-dependent oxidoreductase [Desertimonas flava]|jgi:NAD(P)-dependent dehydrogenase (short-subunit alcohol dehydrogenase family)|uniref:SDR family NAD(P)-dependent oxidoreductase n=1 Tax=Desertimonas flava TaxID=2064846 RepID=UPI001878A7D8|nr:SDR family oxidoreductase [Desertimonas flava]